jgi:hypothetical protein
MPRLCRQQQFVDVLLDTAVIAHTNFVRVGLPKLRELSLHWKCLVCQPPSGIQQLQAFLTTTTTDFNTRTGELEDVVHELEIAESNHAECLTLLDRQDSIVTEIQSEIMECDCPTDDTDTDAVAQDEVDLWTQQPLDHDTQLMCDRFHVTLFDQTIIKSATFSFGDAAT